MTKHDWHDHSSSPHHHEGDDTEPVWDSSVAVAEPSLDEAWAAAEAALPEGWLLQCSGPWDGPMWRFYGRCVHTGNCHYVPAEGPTPAAALSALATALREKG